jgi:hypothetical protein
MKFDIREPLARSEYEILRHSQNLKADLGDTLSKAKQKRLQTFLNDPDYFLRLVRPCRGKAAYLLLRLVRPIYIVPVQHKLFAAIEKLARHTGQTANQFTQAAVRHQLDLMESAR